jgi:hypothetical protein
LAQLGWLVAALARRSIAPAAMALGLVLTLAFFDTAGGLALGAASMLLVLAPARTTTRASTAAA